MSKLLTIEPITLVIEVSYSAVNAAASPSGNHILRKGFAEIVEAKGVDGDKVSAFFTKGGNGDFLAMVDLSAVKPPKGKGKLQAKPAAKPASEQAQQPADLANQIAAAVAAALANQKS
jgi:hypothetical protein